MTTGKVTPTRLGFDLNDHAGYLVDGDFDTQVGETHVPRLEVL